jgi:hypothetical protein
MIKTFATISLTISALAGLTGGYLGYLHANTPHQVLHVIFFVSYLTLCLGLIPLICMKLAKAYPESKNLLKSFSLIILIELILCYFTLVYQDKYQTGLSILISSSVIAMGWWIQNINHITNSRKAHTLNIMMQSRMSSAYLERLEAYTQIFKGEKFVSEELARLGDLGKTDAGVEFGDLTREIRDAYEGLRYLLNYYEFLSQGIKAKDLDEYLIRECFCGFMQTLEKKCFYVIKLAQERDKLHFDGLIWLLEKWGLSTYKSNLEKVNPEKDLGEPVNIVIKAKKKVT